MNGRTVFAVNRSPVLAWNVEPPQPLPYADMPAAAAAISPVVSPADPYARCWQNQVDAGSGFSYFGALYNNSLPPTAYRLQPGCMANLGQFWPPTPPPDGWKMNTTAKKKVACLAKSYMLPMPPTSLTDCSFEVLASRQCGANATPPPDGCGRFDGSNLYLGPHVFRHGENIPSNLRNSYQGLGHYSHVVETPKETSQRTFKRETPISPNVNTSGISISSSVSKSENLNTLCVIDSKLKPQVTISSTVPKQEIISASSSSHEPFLCAPDSRGSSSMHPSTDKACFSPPYSLKSTINFHNSSQDSSAHKAKVLNGTQENNCNASPLKNVYFSSIESENVNSMLSKKFKNSDEHFRFEPKSVSLDVNKSKNSLQSSNSLLLHNTYSSKKYEVAASQEFCNINSNCKMRSDKQTDCVVLVGEQQYKQKNNICRVKPEKNNHSDCKYQKSTKNSNVLQVSEYRTSSDVFNIPTSVIPPKLEPNDKYFLSNCSSSVPSCMANSYANSGPYLLTKEFTPGYRNMVYPNSCSLSKPWQMNELPLISPENYFKAPEAAKPPVPGPPYASSVLHEELISVAQTAPQGIDVIRMNGKLQQGSQPSKKVLHESSDDDEVQIISVQTKQTSASKSASRHVAESKPSQSPVVSAMSPLCLKSEKEPEETDKSSAVMNLENAVQWIKTEPVPPVLERETSEERTATSGVITENKTSETQCTSKELPQSDCQTVTIKKEVIQEEEPINDCDASETEQKVFESEDVKPNIVVSEEPLSDEKNSDDCSNTSKMPDLVEECNENVPNSDFNDNHNLNLLLNTIEKVTSLEKSNLLDVSKPIKSEITTDTKISEKSMEVYPELPKTCGLDLLSVIAGQRLVTEFDSVSEKEDIKSNYPLIKKDDKSTSEEQAKPNCDLSSSLQKATVFEMQDRLKELQKKYKQKQKELSRLKPKKRFTNTYLSGRKKSGDFDVSSGSNMDSSDLNSSACSASSATGDDVQILDNQPKDGSNDASSAKPENKNGIQANKGTKRKLPSRKCNSEGSQPPEKHITTRSSSRHSVKQLKCDDDCSNTSEHSRKTRSSRNKGYQLRKMKELSLSNSVDDDIQIISIGDESPSKTKESPKKSSPESEKNTKVYSLRHSSQANKKQETPNVTSDTVTSSKAITSKRKSDNPRKYMPSKQGKLSETIIAKHLRSRILFDTSGEDENTKDGGVPEELYDALMKCHLEDQSKKEVSGKSLELSSAPLASPEPSKLKLENLVVKQRLLALEDGLFYAGYIKEVQSSDRYGIALDGQRGNRLHIFTQEELLTQAIVESKPLSSELPEGTRVCAYWSQQYRCLYPGIVGKAPCPSADWSEPRVFVLFDDGDSGQIPTKNIRLIPSDVIPAENDQACDSPTELPRSSSDLNGSAQEHTPRRLRCSTSKTSSPVKECDTSNENESKDSSCASVNDSSCDDSCFIEYSLSPSQNSENYLRIENSACSISNSTDAVKVEKRQRKRSKRKASCHIKFKEHEEVKEKCEAKTKRHKKYKEKHRKHHHHHHHHRHHHHHHHHSKKHKHKKKNGKTFTTQDLEKVNFIPCSVSHKSFKNFQVDAEACTNHVEHSSTVNLPQNENDRIC